MFILIKVLSISLMMPPSCYFFLQWFNYVSFFKQWFNEIILLTYYIQICCHTKLSNFLESCTWSRGQLSYMMMCNVENTYSPRKKKKEYILKNSDILKLGPVAQLVRVKNSDILSNSNKRCETRTKCWTFYNPREIPLPLAFIKRTPKKYNGSENPYY